MRILVIDDKQLHRTAAVQTLQGHDLTLVDSYDEAQRVLGREVPYGQLKAWALAHGHAGYLDAPREAQEQALSELRPAPFDAVLTDLLMPAGRSEMGGEGEKYIGQEMPVGFSLALQAVLHGAKYVAVVTATNHHCHPASAMLDRLGGGTHWHDKASPFSGVKRSEAAFRMNGTVVGFFHHPPVLVEGTVCGHCAGETRSKETCLVCGGTGLEEGKHWGKVLERLLEANANNVTPEPDQL